jgi:hypothetical protein
MSTIIARALRVLRSLAAGVLLAAFFLPLARCESGHAPDAPGTPPRAEDLMVPADLVDLEDPTTLIVAAFFAWPLLLLGLYALRPRARRFEFFEALPAAATFWYLWQITVDWGEVLWAGYAALVATALYGFAALLAAPAAFRAWRTKPP